MLVKNKILNSINSTRFFSYTNKLLVLPTIEIYQPVGRIISQTITILINFFTNFKFSKLFCKCIAIRIKPS